MVQLKIKNESEEETVQDMELLPEEEAKVSFPDPAAEARQDLDLKADKCLFIEDSLILKVLKIPERQNLILST